MIGVNQKDGHEIQVHQRRTKFPRLNSQISLIKMNIA